MRFKKILSVLFMGLLINACVSKEYVKQRSVFIVFKTPAFKYADLGFIYENDKDMKVEIYSSGQPVMTLSISRDSVCLSLLECMSKKTFNRRVLSKNYPNSILNNIFKGQKIFNGENLEKTSSDFTQILFKANKYDIKYTVLNKEILFRDKINNVLIKIKRLQS